MTHRTFVRSLHYLGSMPIVSNRAKRLLIITLVGQVLSIPIHVPKNYSGLTLSIFSPMDREGDGAASDVPIYPNESI